MSIDLKEGDLAPAFDLETDTGRVSLAGLKGRRIALFFYPKDDTTACTAEAIAFSQARADFAAAGAEVVGISRDTARKHASFRKKHGLTVDLGADVDGAVTEAYGVWVEKSMYGRSYMGIERATFLIDGDARIRRVWRKVRVAGHVEEVLAAAKALEN